MNDRKEIEQEVQRTLDLLGQAQAVDSDPYLYSRIMARMEVPAVGSYKMKYALALAGVCVLVFLNVAILMGFGQSATSSPSADIVNDYGMKDAFINYYE